MRLLKLPLARTIRDNLPSRKPQLWENLRISIWRRASAAICLTHYKAGPEVPRRITIRPLGFSMWLRYAGYLVDRAIFVFDVYEIATTKLFQAALGRGLTVIDVGAHSGYFTLLAASLVGPQGRIIAFEPVPENLARLRDNLALNEMNWVSTYDFAVSDSNGTAPLFLSNDPHNDGISSLVPRTPECGEVIRVSTITLDSFFQDHGVTDVHLIKIDVEGAEEGVLKGSEWILRSKCPMIVFESFQPENVVRRLEGLEYTVKRLHYRLPGGLEFYEVGETFDDLYKSYEAPNYLAIKNGSPLSFDELRQRAPRAEAWVRTLAKVF